METIVINIPTKELKLEVLDAFAEAGHYNAEKSVLSKEEFAIEAIARYITTVIRSSRTKTATAKAVTDVESSLKELKIGN